MKHCISQTCTLPRTFAEDVLAYSEGECFAIEVWLTKLEDHLQSNSLADTRKLIEDRGVSLPVASGQGGLLLSQGEQKSAHVDHFRRRLDLCAAFGTKTLVLQADFLGRIDQPTVERAVESLRDAALWAQAVDVRLALEFSARASFCACIETTLAFLAACGEANLGLCLDVFHYYVGPSKFEDLARLNSSNLFHVQVCDLAGVARELAEDRDRILPGEGDFQLSPIVQHLQNVGYDGFVSLELLNPVLWQVKPAHLAEMAMKSLKRLL